MLLSLKNGRGPTKVRAICKSAMAGNSPAAAPIPWMEKKSEEFKGSFIAPELWQSGIMKNITPQPDKPNQSIPMPQHITVSNSKCMVEIMNRLNVIKRLKDEEVADRSLKSAHVNEVEASKKLQETVAKEASSFATMKGKKRNAPQIMI
jgi:hypothetical protein